MHDYSRLSHQQLLAHLKELQTAPTTQQLIDDDADHLLHELQVHQVELEIQNRELRETQQQLELSRQRYQTLYELAPVGYLQLDSTGQIRQINHAGTALLDQPAAQLKGKRFSDWLTNTADQQHFEEHLRHTLARPGQIEQLELIIQNPAGQPRCLMVISQTLLDNLPTSECCTVLVDITDRVRAAALEHDVQHDALTGLANRNLLMQRLELALQRAARHEDFRFALLFLDLNRFKAINDSLGHQVGDQVLIALAEQLQTFVRRVDLAARLAGDEFVILLENIAGLHQAVQIAERIVETHTKPLRLLSGQELFISVSIGIANGSGHYSSAGELLRDADIAMYRAKHHSHQNIVIFDDSMRDQALERLQLEQELRQALEADDQLLVYFQPIVELVSGQVRELEALVRWQHPRHGLLHPAAFIPLTEGIGLTVRLGEWVLQQACQQLQDWRKRFSGIQDLGISVNLSPQQYREQGFPQRLGAILEHHELPGQCLNLELTERHLISDTAWFIDLLAQLADLGVSLSIDDFGAGYSSLSHLPRYALKYLKIDPAFISDIGIDVDTDNDLQREKIVQAILDLTQHLPLEVVAVGIETPAQLAFLRQVGCPLGQGELFSPPCLAADLEGLLAQPGGPGYPPG